MPFLAVAFTRDEQSFEVRSALYAWNETNGRFALQQTFPTTAAVDVAHLPTQHEHLLMFANLLTIEDELAAPSPGEDAVATVEAPTGCAAQRHKLRFWRPQEAPGFRRLGDVLTMCAGADACAPEGHATLLREGAWLAPPLGFDALPWWDEPQADGDGDAPAEEVSTVTVWRPRAPPGFVCLGEVVTPDTTAPDTDVVRCVDAGLVRPAPVAQHPSPVRWDNVCGGPDDCPGAGGCWSYVELPGSLTFARVTAAELAADAPPTRPQLVQRPYAAVQSFLARGASPVYRYSRRTGRFEHLQDVPTVGPAALEAFSITEPLAGTDISRPRHFIAVANRQAQAPVVLGGPDAFDQAPVLLEWSGGRLAVVQNFSSAASLAEDPCDALPAGRCACTDEDARARAELALFGDCASYAPGEVNHGFCEADGACGACGVSCAGECRPECAGATQEEFERRTAGAWDVASGLRGATGLRYFSHAGQHFLAVAQSVCDLAATRAECAAQHRTQPYSAVLQWNGEAFGPLLALDPHAPEVAATPALRDHHAFALRLPAGAALGFEFAALPGPPGAPAGAAPLLIALSLTKGVLAYRWAFDRVSRLRGVAAVAAGAADPLPVVWAVSDVARSVASIEHAPVLDSLGATAARLRLRAFDVAADPDADAGAGAGAALAFALTGARRVREVAPPAGGAGATLVVDGGLRTSELLCAVPPLDAALLAPWHQTLFASACQALSFNVTLDAGDPALLAAPPALAADGSLRFAVAPHASGSASYTAVAEDSGGARAPPRRFAVRVTTLNSAPRFFVSDVELPEDGGEQALVFATGVDAGGADEDWQELEWLFSFTNPALFAAKPQLSVVAGEGVIRLTPALDAFGESTVRVRLRDSGGQLARLTPDGATVLEGEDTSPATEFTVRVLPRNDPPRVALRAQLVVSPGGHAQRVEDVVTRAAPGPPNEAGQALSFALVSVRPAGGVPLDGVFFAEPPALARNGTLSFTLLPSSTGNVHITFALRDDGGAALPGESDAAEAALVLVVVSENLAPRFEVDAVNTLYLPRTADPELAFTLPGFARGITAGSPAEDRTQRLSFTLSNVSNPALFTAPYGLPAISLDGTLTLTLASSAPGRSSALLTLDDDGGRLKRGRDTSGPVPVVLAVQRVNLAPSFALRAAQVHAVENQGAYEERGFALELSAGAPDEEAWQTLSFSLAVVASVEGLFEPGRGPAIDSEGTLRFTPALGMYGRATVSARVTDDGGTGAGGEDVSAGPPQVFTVLVQPQPRLAAVSPRIGAAAGGTRVTITGEFLEPAYADDEGRCAVTRALVGGTPCAQTLPVDARTLVCVAPPGVGVADVTVESTLLGATRVGTLQAAFQRLAVVYGGVAQGASTGVLAVGPSADYPGSALRPAASAQLLDGFAQAADRGVRAVAALGSTLYLGGSFTRAGGVPVYHVAAFDGAAARPLGMGVDGVVNALAPLGALLVVGGGFAKAFQPLDPAAGAGAAGVLESGGLAGWDGARWQLVGGEALQGFVTCLLAAGGGARLFVGGRFSAPRRDNNLAVFDTAAERWSSVCDAAGACGVRGGDVHALAAQGEDLYVGGSFTLAGAVRVQGLARWDGRRFYAMGAFDSPVLALALVRGQLVAGGGFAAVDGQPRAGLARFHGGRWEGVGGGVGGIVHALAGAGDCLWAAGELRSAGGAEVIAGVPVRNAANWCYDAGAAARARWDAVDWSGAEVGPVAVVAALQGN